MANPHDKFWAFSDDGITVIEKPSILGTDTSKPSDKPIDRVLAAQTKESLCNGEDCGWGYPVATGLGHVVVPNYKSGRVTIFDVEDGDILANVPTCQSPFRVEVAAWRYEVYVHCGDGNVDTLNMVNWGMKQPLVDAVFTSSKFVHGDIVLNEALPEYAWTTNTADPGYHKIHLKSRAIQFVNLQSEGCTTASHLAISGHNHHGFIRCSSNENAFILEINLEDDKVVKKIDIPGYPFVSKSELSVVVADSEQNKLHMFKTNGNGQPSELEAAVGGIEGFSQLKFVRSEDSDVHLAVVSSLTQYKVLLVDMNDYTNTETVDYLEAQSLPALDEVHGEQRSLAATYDSDRVVVAVSARELNSTFLMRFEVGKGIEETLQIEQIQGIRGDRMKLIYVEKPDTVPPLPTVQRNIATIDALKKLETKMGAAEVEAEQMKQQLSSLGTTIEHNKQQASQEREAASKEREAASKEREAAKGEREAAIKEREEAAKERSELEKQLSIFKATMEQNKQLATQEKEAASSEISSNESSIDTARKIAIAGVVLASVASVGILALAAVVISGLMRSQQSASIEQPQPYQNKTGKQSKASHNPKLDTVSLGSTEFGEDCHVRLEV
ncbi:hypothetical protein DUNSADRAFT_1215 [Dunaliella salina]|uniref:Uncharacterized protein n=1 Tax=Dunaliella salina TaxID=3046 RepID=A0ABQ7GXD9_DUNSA|nr:hypothetical protein DUNSADRAFT_1215 [Dunaliella salina]|eukprot:KAF5839271.1 hypothetical protein DUNSADRAFT_1215 [Dunaliella salina]